MATQPKKKWFKQSVGDPTQGWQIGYSIHAHSDLSIVAAWRDGWRVFLPDSGESNAMIDLR